MIVQEQINNTLIRTYSDKNVYIHGGFPEGDYAEAIDPISLNRVYTETDIPIPEPEDEPVENGYLPPQVALNMLFGGTSR